MTLWHAEVTTQLGEDNTGAAAVSFAGPNLRDLVAKIQREHPYNYGFSIYNDATGYIYPSALYQKFIDA